ncbi:unnamed protein product [Urochloa humidicola]
MPSAPAKARPSSPSSGSGSGGMGRAAGRKRLAPLHLQDGGARRRCVPFSSAARSDDCTEEISTARHNPVCIDLITSSSEEEEKQKNKEKEKHKERGKQKNKVSPALPNFRSMQKNKEKEEATSKKKEKEAATRHKSTLATSKKQKNKGEVTSHGDFQRIFNLQSKIREKGMEISGLVDALGRAHAEKMALERELEAARDKVFEDWRPPAY